MEIRMKNAPITKPPRLNANKRSRFYEKRIEGVTPLSFFYASSGTLSDLTDSILSGPSSNCLSITS
jgi:hypothetical protein